MPMLRLLVVDDHAVFRAGLAMLLNAQPDLEVVGEAADGNQAIEKVREQKPDLVLMDLTMPSMDGIEATRRIKEVSPDTKILVLSMHEDEEYLLQVLKHGAAGYVAKKAADTELISAIHAVHRGEIFLHSSVTRAVLRGYLQDERDPAKKRATDGGTVSLSDREREVLRLIALGHTNQEIADMLLLSVKTVETHKARIKVKLGVERRSDLVRYAMKVNLIKPQ
ncbi:MAG: response regulator transcription factor [Firmicutes bacterium]|nr:response regulator transcription factor [Bacillota bacterium]